VGRVVYGHNVMPMKPWQLAMFITAIYMLAGIVEFYL